MLLFILYFLIYNSALENEKLYTKLQTLSAKDVQDKEKQFRNLEWEQMNADVFFKRTGAFYIIEKQLLQMLFISKNEKNIYIILS